MGKRNEDLYEIVSCSHSCDLEVFKIRGVDAMGDKNWFFDQSDVGDSSESDGACVDMQGFPMPATFEMMKSYNITEDEFNIIAQACANAVSFGNCNACD